MTMARFSTNPAFLRIFGVDSIDELKNYHVSDSWAPRSVGESLEETVNRADRELIQVRVIKRPGSYTRRTPPEAKTE